MFPFPSLCLLTTQVLPPVAAWHGVPAPVGNKLSFQWQLSPDPLAGHHS